MKYIKFKKVHVKKIALGLVLVMGISQLQMASATTLDTAKEKKSEAESELGSVKNKIGEIETKQADLKGQIKKLDKELVEVIYSLEILKDDISIKEEELDQVKADLAQAQKEEETQYGAMKKRIQYMYERGDDSFMTAILESESISQLLNKAEYFNEVYDYDKELLVAYQTAKLKVIELEKEVECEIAEMEELQHNYKVEKKEYKALISEKKTEVANFDGKLSEAKTLAEEYKATIQEQNSIIRQEEERIEKERQAEAARQAEAERLAEAARQAEANSSNNGSSNDTSGSDSSGGSNNSGNSGGSGSSDSGGSKNPGQSTGTSGSAVVNYACGFIGKPYVWGGTDPNTGADCSGFTQYVYRQFGISIPRTSGAQRSAGKEVSYSNAQPGDLICYSGHVAIYMGNGQIVHASNSAPYPSGGIKTGSATYRTILSVRRVL